MGTLGDSSRLSLIVAGSLTPAEFGNESDGGSGEPEFELVHNIASGLATFDATHPAGNAGGVRASKFSEKTAPGLEQGVGVGADGASLVADTDWLTQRRRAKAAVKNGRRFI